MLKKLTELLTIQEEDLPRVQPLLTMLMQGGVAATAVPVVILFLFSLTSNQVDPRIVSSLVLMGVLFGLQRLNRQGTSPRRVSLIANLFLAAVLLFAVTLDPFSSPAVKLGWAIYIAIPPVAALLLPPEASFIWSGLTTAAIVIRLLILTTFSDADIDFAQLVFDIAGLQVVMLIVWFSSRMFHQTRDALRRQIQQSQAGIEIGYTITAALDAPLIVRQAVQLIKDAFGYYHVGLFLVDLEGETALLVDAAGADAASLKEREFHVSLDSAAAVAVAINEKSQRMVVSWEANRDGSGRPVQFTHSAHARSAISARAELAIPLLVRDQVLGALDILSIDLAPFSEDAIHTLGGLVGHISNAIEHARLFEETQRRAAQETVLSEIGRQISATLDLTTVLERIATQAHDVLGVDTSAVFLRQPDGHIFRAIVAVGHAAEEIKASVFRSGEGIIGNLARRGLAEIVNGVSEDPRASQASGTLRMPGENLMVSPLMTRGRVSGMAAVWRIERQGVFSQEELAFLARLSDQAAIAIENARLFEETQRRAAQEATLSEMGRVLTTMLDMDTVVENVYRYTSRLIDTTNFYVGLYNEEKDTLSFALYIENNERLHTGDEWPLGMGLTSEIIRTGSAIVTNDYTTECIRRGITPGGRVSYAWMGVPLRAADRVIGIMNVSSFAPEVVYTPEQGRIFSAIADQAAIVFENARLFEQIRQANIQLQTAAEVSQAVSSILNPGELIQQVVKVIRERFDLYYAGLFLVDEAVEWAVLQAGTGEAGQKMLAQGHKLEIGGGSMIGQCVAKKQPRVALDVGKEAVYFENPFLPETRSETALPLVSRGEAIGALTIQSTQEAAFSDETIIVLQTMADQVAIALDNARLFHDTQEALEAVKQADQAKSTFLATMSHELRTPLNGILGYAQILRRDSTLTQRQLNGLGIIEQSGEYLLSLINDLLDMARIEAGRIDLYKADFDLPAFLQSISEMIHFRAEDKGLYFRTEFVLNGAGEGLPAIGVHSDEGRLRQVLINLLGNAIKFTDKGGVTFRVRRTPPTTPPAEQPPSPDLETVFHFEIEDTGIGLSPEELAIIFEPFRQAGDRRHQRGGSGLGLAISRNLIKLMKSDLHVKSTPGKGTTFWFDLPLPEVAGWVATPTAQDRPIVGIAGPAPTVLVVDDNEPNRAVVVNLLAPLGFKILEAGDGQAGLARANEHRPDAVITDLVMPEMDGLELTRLIRQSPSLKDIVVIAISASAYEEDRQQSLDAGSDAFIRKPVSADLLFAELQQRLGLEWVYADESWQPAPAPEKAGAPPLIPPPPDELAALHQLTVVGDVRAIQQRADELEQLDEQLKPFADELRRLAKGFQIDRIRDLITSWT